MTAVLSDPTAPVDSVTLLRQWIRNGWEFRLKKNPDLALRKDEYVARTNYELSVILPRPGVPDYFLIVSDLVRYAKDNGIGVGPGRGSAAGSLICWWLRITEIDPLPRPNMLFERFLDPVRDDLPDIDIDFEDDRRHEVIAYAQRKYGEDRVGQIANYSRFRGRLAIKDIGRVYNIPFLAKETLKNLIIDREAGDPRINDSVFDTLSTFERAQNIAEKYPDIWMAAEFEGDYRGMSMHAAGIVISTRPLDEICATYTKKIGKTKATQRTVSMISDNKKGAEHKGLQKIDFLGLTTMGMITRALRIIGMSLTDLYDVPMDDTATLQAFRDGDVAGIFQFDGRTQRGVTRAVSPETLEQLIDISALSRPGPLQSGEYEAYVARRHGRARIPEQHPVVAELTADSFGTTIYQEQVFLTLARIGGFPSTMIGDIRRIISAKLGEAAFNAMYAQFEQGARDHHGIDPAEARAIWNKMVSSSKYLFNYAHSCSYSFLAYWCMWLKVHHPVAFFAAQLSKVGPEKLPRIMQDCLNHDIGILPPDPMLSGVTWEPDLSDPMCMGMIRAGFLQVPKVGPATAPLLVEYRDAHVLKQGTIEQFSWDQFINIAGVGPVTVQTMRTFSEAEDPFGLQRVGKVLQEYRVAIRTGRPGYLGLPIPTHTSEDIPEEGELHLVWMGFVKNIRFDNEIEKRRRYSDDPDITDEEILANLKDPELLDSAVLFCYDEGGEEVKVRVGRYVYPYYRLHVNSIVKDEDVIVVQGTKKDYGGFGANIYVDRLDIIEPDEPEAEDADNEAA
jgi:DNA polymerase-3 subunit alpha